MKCPNCDEHTFSVLSTRGGTADDRGDPVLVRWARGVVGDWTYDWIARRRRCSLCGHEARSIEILEEDVEALLKPTSPPEPETTTP